MGSLVGILSTVILVSTLATLVFAVFAYVASRQRQTIDTDSKHTGDHPIPDVESAPALPEEFVMRMHHVEEIGRSRSREPGETVEGASKEPAPNPPPANVAPQSSRAGPPVFRSLSEKKPAADPAPNAPDTKNQIPDE